MKKFFLFVLFQFFFYYSITYSQDFEVKKTYDKFSKTTTFAIDEKLVVKGTNTFLKLHSYAGVDYTLKDTNYWWFFWKTRGDREVAFVNDLISIMIDDSIMKIVPNSVKTESDRIYYYFFITKENFLKIAKGKIVDIQIKNQDFIYEGRFKEDDLQILKKFLEKY